MNRYETKQIHSGEKALMLLEKALADPNAGVRRAAAETAGCEDGANARERSYRQWGEEKDVCKTARRAVRC